MVLDRIDAVVNDMNLVRIDVEEPHDVGLCLLRHGDHCVRHLDGSFLQPAGEIIPPTKLLTLPRAQRLQRMNGEHHRQTVIQLGQDASEVRVPSVKMDNLGVDVLRVEVQIALQRAKDGF